MMSRSGRWVWVIVVLLPALVVGPTLAAERPHAEVAAWNLEWFDSGPRGENSQAGPRAYPLAYQTIAQIVRGEGPAAGQDDLEIVGLEEVTGEKYVTALLHFLPGWRALVLSARAGSQRNALLWNAQRVSVQELPALKLGGPREAVHVRFRVGAFDGDYVVAHLKSGGGHNERETREGECRALSAWLHNPNGPSAPTDADVLIGGDLNTEANETALQMLLNDPWLVWCFAGLAQPPVTRPCSGRTIDHIFMTSDCRPNLRRTTVLRAPYDALGADEYRRLVSDHLPVVVSLYTDEDPDG